MELRGREYLHHCNHNEQLCDETRLRVASYLSQLRKDTKIKGYLFRTILKREDLVEESVSDEAINDLTELMDKKFPFLYGTITFVRDKISDVELEEFERRFSLTRTRSY